MPKRPRGGVEDLAVADANNSTNLLGPLRLTAALLPRLIVQPRATVMTVSSGLAFVPIAQFHARSEWIICIAGVMRKGRIVTSS